MLINLELTQYSGVHGLSLVGFPLNLRLTQLDWILEPCTRCKVMEYGLSIEKKKKKKKKKELLDRSNLISPSMVVVLCHILNLH